MCVMEGGRKWVNEWVSESDEGIEVIVDQFVLVDRSFYW